MATQGFTLPSNAWQGEGQSDSAEVQRLQAELMRLKASRDPGKPMDTGTYSVLNMNPLIDAMSERATEQKLEVARKKERDLQGRYQEAMVEALRGYQGEKAGVAKEVAGPTMDGSPLMREGQPNMRAFEQGRVSPFPQVRQLAEADAKEYGELRKELANRADFGSVQRSGGDIGRMAPKDDYKVVDNTLVNAPEGGVPRLTAGGGYTQIPGQQPGEMMNRNNLTGRVSGEGGVKVSINNPGKKLSETAIEAMPKALEKAQAANSALRSTETALQALQEGAQAGYGQEWLQNAKTLVSGVTGVQFEAQTPTAVLAKALAKNVIDELGGLGAQISNSDRDFMQQAIGGLNTDPKALERILAIRMGALQRSLDEYNGKTVDSTAKMMDTPQDAEFTRSRFGVERNKVSYAPKSMEAEASYVANLRNIPYAEALAFVKSQKPDYGQAAALEVGNIDLSKRPRINNPDGSVSTLSSISVNIDGKEVLIPTIAPDGRRLSDSEALALYRQTGQHLGKFNSAAEATAFAKQLSARQGRSTADLLKKYGD